MTSLVADYSSSGTSSGSESNDADNMFSDDEGNADDEEAKVQFEKLKNNERNEENDKGEEEYEIKRQNDGNDGDEEEEKMDEMRDRNNGNVKNHGDDDGEAEMHGDNEDDDDEEDEEEEEEEEEEEDERDDGNEDSEMQGHETNSNKLSKKKEDNFSNVNDKLPLPTPNFNSTSTLLKTSVFSNPFVEAEKAKSAILEKHVKMTPTLDDTKMINGRKICWNYRKGRCRFGHNCTFAHDSDIHKNSPAGLDSLDNHLSRRGHRRRKSNCATTPQEIVICQTNFNHYNQSAINNDNNDVDNYNDNDTNDNDDVNVDDDNFDEIDDQENNSLVQKRKKKKRPGLSQTLIPGKRVFKIYKSQADISR